MMKLLESWISILAHANIGEVLFHASSALSERTELNFGKTLPHWIEVRRDFQSKRTKT
jgi:hypothetical protein